MKKTITIEIKNAAELAAREDNPLVRILEKMSPALVENQVIEAVKDKIQKALAAEGVKAVVAVTFTPDNPQAIVKAGGSSRAGYIIAGAAGAAGLVYLLMKR